ncbi:esterase-like activity of phytase family protein [Prevotella veroralis]|uniref:esterase-like activity of phytase family protein n=1 Tax=Prevotella veroralis TaxID=28137 RepID=UPI00035F753D|nr:esterase-like activity of phytase family protein [Prevotella veroralis]
MMFLSKIIFSICCVHFLTSFAQTPKLVRMNPQHYFHHNLPKGNYSGLTSLGNETYAVVSDKAPKSGFFVFHIQIDHQTGDILDIISDGFRPSSDANQDEEGIAFFPKDSTIFISREGDNAILEYAMDGHLTGKRLKIPATFKDITHQYGFEALTYNKQTHLFWTTSESTLKQDGVQANAQNQVNNRLRLQSFDENFMPQAQFAYLMDKPISHKSASNYAMGVPALTALDDGKLLVLEREFLVTSGKLGSFVSNKIYCVDPLSADSILSNAPLQAASPYLPKTLIAEWKTSLTLFRQDLANYEGMCLGPKLSDGSQVLILCADSQNQYGGVLRDWFRTIVIR